MSFRWVDRKGASHELDSCEAIIREKEEIEKEVGRLLDLFVSNDVSIHESARAELEVRTDRLRCINADLLDWNEYALDWNRQVAANIKRQIDDLTTGMREVILVVKLHDEDELLFSETAHDSALRAEKLSMNMTLLQERAIAGLDARAMTSTITTRGKARELLARHPKFARKRSDDGGWFKWIDKDGHQQLLVDPLSIEREAVQIFRELREAQAAGHVDLEATELYAQVNHDSLLINRLSVLKSDLERFETEAAKQDQIEREKFAKNWRERAKRNL